MRICLSRPGGCLDGCHSWGRKQDQCSMLRIVRWIMLGTVLAYIHTHTSGTGCLKSYADNVIVDPDNPLNDKSYSRLRYRGSRQPFEWTGFQARAGPTGVHVQAPPLSTTHTLQYTRTHTGTHTHTNAHIHTHTHTHMHTHTHTHMHTHAHKHTHTHECTFVYVKKKKQSL